MNLTVTLETAKRMKELGWNKECYFKCCGVPNEKFKSGYCFFPRNDWQTPHAEYGTEQFEAPTAQEILDELPKNALKSLKSYEGSFAEGLGGLRIRCKEYGYL